MENKSKPSQKMVKPYSKEIEIQMQELYTARGHNLNFYVGWFRFEV
jgi:hypothetical protein